MGACNSNCISTARTVVDNILNDINRLNRRLTSLDNGQSEELTNSLNKIILLIEKKKTQASDGENRNNIGAIEKSQ